MLRGMFTTLSMIAAVMIVAGAGGQAPATATPATPQDPPCSEPDARGLCAAVSGRGYQIAVPADWGPMRLAPDASADLAFDAPSNDARLTVLATRDSAGPAAVLQTLLDGLLADDTIGNIRVGNGGYAVDLAVPNADAAAGAGAAYTDDAGVDWVVFYLVAAKGQATYLVIVDATGGYLLEHAAQIEGVLASFQVAP